MRATLTPADVDMDPHVPVFPAHISGADTWCQYARARITTQSPLTVSPAEQTALGQMLQHSADGPCPGRLECVRMNLNP